MQNQKKSIVLGLLFGDEGKGVTTQWLCQQATDAGDTPLVIRFSGGPQAGHTVVHDGVEHICSTYGSGTLLGIPTYLSDQVYFDPICAWNEYKVLCDKIGANNVPRLFVSTCCRIITPWDVIAGQSDAKVISDGTCGKGIYHTFKRSVNMRPLTGTFIDARVQGVNSCNAGEYIWTLVRQYYMDLYPKEEFKKMEMMVKPYHAMFSEAWDGMMDVADVVDCSTFDTKEYSHLIFEGSQGMLLDMERGYYPHVTPSKVGLNGVPPEHLQDADVYFVQRTYLTRHGNGYTPKYRDPILISILSNKPESNTTNEWQGEFKVGHHEQKLFQNALERHCIDNYREMYNQRHNLVITHTDIIPCDRCSIPDYTFDGLWECCSREGTFVKRK